MDIDYVEKRFVESTENHQMTVLNNDGLYRHIRFKKPNTSIDFFDLITWPNHLCITGDMGSFLFSRAEDMFSFFRRPELEINPQYWAEKCISQSLFGNGIRQFSKEVFEKAVTCEFKNHLECKRRYVDLSDPVEIKKFGQEMRELWSGIQEDVFGSENDWEAMDSIYRFDCPDGLFQDFWETTITEYTFHFLWALYAIVWGISQYDITTKKAA
jgi:hypothetical protein